MAACLTLCWVGGQRALVPSKSEFSWSEFWVGMLAQLPCDAFAAQALGLVELACQDQVVIYGALFTSAVEGTELYSHLLWKVWHNLSCGLMSIFGCRKHVQSSAILYS